MSTTARELINTLTTLRAEVQKLTAELEKLRADHDALGNDMDAVCIERDGARERLKEALEVNAELRAERDDERRSRFLLEQKRDEANEKTDHLARLLAIASEEARRANTRPEPSRLKIAAMLKAGWHANSTSFAPADFDCAVWLKQADALIATAKEVAK